MIFLTKEEKKAIDELWRFDCCYNEQIKAILNLIEKQQAEIEKKDEEIDEMAETLSAVCTEISAVENNLKNVIVNL